MDRGGGSMITYTIYKLETDTEIWSEVEQFNAYRSEDSYACFKNAVERLYQLQHEKIGTWLDRFTFETDFFVYRLFKSETSKVNIIQASTYEANRERLNSLLNDFPHKQLNAAA